MPYSADGISSAKLGIIAEKRETTETVRTATLVLTEGDKVVLEGFEQFFFPPDSIRPILSEENQRFLDELASFLAQNPTKQLLITGFYLQSESSAPSGFFENPGHARAAQIGMQLEDRGIDPHRVTLHNMALERDSLLEPVRFLIRKSTGPLLISDPKTIDMEFLKTLFASFDQAESLIFMAFVLIAFLIGFVLSWLVWTRQARKWRLEAQQSKAELKALQAEYQSFKDQFALREADIQHAQVEAEESKRRMLGAQEERSRLAAELEEAYAELARLQSSVAAQQVTIEDLNDQILGLRTKNETLVAESMETTDQVDEIYKVEAEKEENVQEEEPLQPIDAVAEMQSTFNAALQRLNAIEEKLRRIETENENLRNRVAVAQAAPRSLAAVEQLFDTEVEEEDEEAIVQQAREYLQSAIGSMIPAAVEAQKDDLQQIQGIGPFLEKQLHSVGLYTYEQISKLDETLIEQLTKAIQFFPGRILKDDWVGQARRLHDNPKETPREFRPVSSENESLRIIEGIGPKIEALLADSGIHSLKDLAEADVERLQEILHAAGERYRLHDPSTWPEQARLATEGEWDQLKSFKEYLNRGEHKG